MNKAYKQNLIKITFYLFVYLVVSAGFLLEPDNVIAATSPQITVSIKGDTSDSIKVELVGGDLSSAVEKKVSNGKASFKKLSAGEYTVTPRKSGVTFNPPYKLVTVVDKNVRVTFNAKEEEKKVGMAYCVSCHKNVNSEVYSDWMQGAHGNFKYEFTASSVYDYADFTSSFSYPSDYSKFTGHPSFNEIKDMLKEATYSGKKDGYCLKCHGPSSNDNKKVATFPLVRSDGSIDTVNKDLQITRPVVGCEACHGSGRNHISHPKKSVTHKEPNAAQCGQCHNKDFPAGHLDANPLGAAGTENPGIYQAYVTSAHAQSLTPADIYTDAKKKAVKPLCAKCHTDQGAKVYKAIDGDASTLPGRLSGEAGHTEFDAVQCRTCHNAHNPEELLESATAATSTATARSAEFNTCTNCHQLLDSSDAKITPYHSDHAASITNTHYDSPATAALEGYNIDRASTTACSDCHNPHIAGIEINKQWAKSGHGDVSADPWSHYDWKTTARKDCQRCHTTTGFANIATNQETYNASNNSFPHLTGLQNEVLYCNACHTDSSFKRRSIGGYDGYVKFPSGDKVKLDDDSNLCLLCHQGRASKVDVDTKISAGAAPYTSFTNIHYLAAAATFFGTETRGGYEYTGKTYVSRNTFTDHKGKFDTCVKCHLRKESAESPDHHFLPEVSDCASSSCHNGITAFSDIRQATTPDYDGDGNTTEGIKGEVDTLRAALYTQIKLYAKNTVLFAIVYDESTNPYWFRDTNGNGTKDTGETTGYNKFDAKLLKAAYNYHVSIKDPNGYIHNHKYFIELLYDSIQDLGGTVTSYTRP